jgi:uncharacterized protein YegP (UPF0339 family)
MELHVKKDHAGEVRWTAIADGNYKKLGDSGEGYHHQQDALAGFALIRGCTVEELLDGSAGVKVVFDVD